MGLGGREGISDLSVEGRVEELFSMLRLWYDRLVFVLGVDLLFRGKG